MYGFEVWGGGGIASVQLDGLDVVNVMPASVSASAEPIQAEHVQPIYDRIAWVAALSEEEYLRLGGTHLEEQHHG
jgi:hypothetical protein